MSDAVPMTRDGYNKIKADIERMESVEMPAIAEKIAAAREEGDLKENQEYHAQRENQGMLQAKINNLKDKLARSVIIDTSQIDTSKVCLGVTVVVRDVEFDDEETFTFVGAGEEDYMTGKILVTSPVGQGLIGRAVGDVCEIQIPKGTMQYEILEIRVD